jgi:CHAT domain-containing protein
MIEPDGVLSDVAFSALVGGDGNYLAERFLLVTSPGVLYLARLRESDPITAKRPALVIGAPSEQRATTAFPVSLRALPEAADEARIVASRFERPVLLSGPTVTLDRVERELPLAVVIHFAGHARNDVGGTGLLLSGSGEIMAPEDLSPARLRRCQLVVLSACSTERGAEEGLYDPDSMVRTFLAAGVPYVVASRWNVDSKAAATLMNHFYTGLLAGQGVLVSLRESAAKLRRSPETAHPYYWAVFSSFGRS